MQLLCLTAMEPPISLAADAVRDEKVKVLRSLRPMERSHGRSENVVRGQYARGFVRGDEVPGYREEPDVAKDSRVETYVAMRVHVDNWRWGGVPFYVRAGKRLARRVTEIAIQFKKVPHRLFRAPDGGISPNVLAMRIQPDEGIALRFTTKEPGPADHPPRRGDGLPLRRGVRLEHARGLRAAPPRRDARRGDALHAPRRGRGAVGVHRPRLRRLARTRRTRRRRSTPRARGAPSRPTISSRATGGAGGSRERPRARRRDARRAPSSRGSRRSCATSGRRPTTRRAAEVARLHDEPRGRRRARASIARALHAGRRRGHGEHPVARHPRRRSSPTRPATRSTATRPRSAAIEGGRDICSERITLVARRATRARASASAIEALLVPEIPTALVWLGRVHVDDPVLRRARRTTRIAIVLDTEYTSLASLLHARRVGAQAQQQRTGDRGPRVDAPRRLAGDAARASSTTPEMRPLAQRDHARHASSRRPSRARGSAPRRRSSSAGSRRASAGSIERLGGELRFKRAPTARP